jgi:hypothetical protein
MTQRALTASSDVAGANYLECVLDRRQQAVVVPTLARALTRMVT